MNEKNIKDEVVTIGEYNKTKKNTYLEYLKSRTRSYTNDDLKKKYVE